ncbi:MAG: MipA/OmpV family protein, partial [Alphaproteobacteria bacterium]|nr:MipA/OmpV family protein [Alphaproteobacteria bacterium]
EGWEPWLSGATALTDGGSESDWRVNLGVGVGAAPDFPGSDDYEVVPLPLVDVAYRDTYFLSTQRGLGVVLFRSDLFRAGPRLTYDRGREESENIVLRGLGDIEPSVEAGVFVEYYRRSWRFSGDLRQGLFDGHQGLIASGSIAVGGRFSDASNLVLGAEIHAADSDYMNAYFGVGQAGAGAGIRDVGAYLDFVYLVTPNVYVTLDTRVSILLGDAAASALTTEDLQYFLGTVVGYRF